MLKLTLHAHAARGMLMTILHVNAACLPTVPFWTSVAFVRGMLKKPLTNCHLTDGQDHGGDGQPPEDHRGKSLQVFLAANGGRGEGWPRIFQVKSFSIYQ